MEVLRLFLLILMMEPTLASAAEVGNTQPTQTASQDRAPLDIPATEIVKGAIGPFEKHSDGYGNPGASGLGYISVLTLETGMAAADLNRKINNLLPFDKAEAAGTYIGQINLIQASSFAGPNGLVWGYHVAQADARATNQLKLLFTKETPDGGKIPVYDIEPLLDAGRRLFGTRDQPRYPMLPGSHIIAAYKDHTAQGPATVWCVLALALSSDPSRNANLFMEACDEVKGEKVPRTFFDKLLRDLAGSVIRVGENQHVRYKEIFVGYRAALIPKGYVGTALAAVPYVVLAKDAVPKEGPEKLLKMSLSDWEKELGLPALLPPKGKR